MIRAAVLCLLATPAVAEVKCFDRDQFIAKADTDYSESQMVRALEDRGGMIEVYVSESGTWTMVYVPNQPGTLLACVLAACCGPNGWVFRAW